MKILSQIVLVGLFGFLSTGISLGFAQSRPLTERLGVGVSNFGPGSTPSLSVDWRITEATGFEATLAINTAAQQNLLDLGVRYWRNLYIEDHLDYALYVGSGLISQRVSGETESGFLLSGGVGSRFRFPSFPNLAFQYGGGVRLSTQGSTAFATEVFFGMHYYF